MYTVARGLLFSPAVKYMTLLKDALFALRLFARNPAFTAVAVLTLGVGIGMSVAVWSVVDAALLMVAVAALATWLPARQATQVEPMTVLRTE
jgi:ABC-type lipoprotein release transport system permease subunit